VAPDTHPGPFVALAVLCERIVPRPDGAVDVHGIVDGVALTPAPPDPLGLKPAGIVSLTAVVSLRAGEARGRHEVSLRGTYPSGADGPAVSRTVEFTDRVPGASLVVPLELEVHEPGTYHFDVRVDGALVTRIPLRVIYEG
jgi:hypothetical protein